MFDFDEIEEAFADGGLGLIQVKVENLEEKRVRLLRFSKEFGDLPEEERNLYEDPESNYSVGWSLGRERMKDGTYDFHKGSFYANPLADDFDVSEEIRKEFPQIYQKNIWPSCLPGYEEAFKDLGRELVQVALEVAKSLDSYVEERMYLKDVRKDFEFYKLLEKTKTCKGRLLNYFPRDSENIDDICSWHVDHGVLTTLVRPMYFLDDQEIDEPKGSGLVVAAKRIEKVHTPKDHVLVQLGETAQMMSGGLLKATPHCVKMTKSGVSRQQFACFLDLPGETEMVIPDMGINPFKVMHLPKGCPCLEKRMESVKTYREFVKNTIQAYY